MLFRRKGVRCSSDRCGLSRGDTPTFDMREYPTGKAQMRIIGFIQDAHCHLATAKRRRAIKDIMTTQGIPDFQGPPPIPKFIDTSHAIDELPSYDSFEPSHDEFQAPLPW